jgi:hypothetical protein
MIATIAMTATIATIATIAMTATGASCTRASAAYPPRDRLPAAQLITPGALSPRGLIGCRAKVLGCCRLMQLSN